ncbi:hypothetical protein [Lachnobacterium bovis]|uniref:Uncharacterized protein n=1 Tax=Lachnobacterium bovis TaxID=140626 RepID=A0A1H9SZJ1_9FIRM|nr:hypothetical protein [Lachnobacterium bovis]SER90385.1 hypothetical protein SAMN02910429_01443 [Lachnobacterium bovis]
MSKEDSYFHKALKNFMYDMASAGTIRALTKKGLSTKEIKKRLDFPTPEDVIREISWEYLVSEKIILLEDPKKETPKKKYKYVKEYGKYGKTSLKRVLIDDEEEIDKESYIPIKFGILLYKDKDLFLKKLEKLNEKDKDFILGLPWPVKIVYYKEDERIKRIIKKLGE